MPAVRQLDAPDASTLFSHPLRRRILAEASDPVSATTLAGRLGETRQKINYHVRVLADAGLLEPAGERPRRGLTERLYRASADAFVIGRRALGPLRPTPGEIADVAGAAHLMALAGRVSDELALSLERADERDARVATLALDTTVRFRSAAQRRAFAEALLQAVADIVAHHTEPAEGGAGWPFRLVVGAYPVPGDDP